MSKSILTYHLKDGETIKTTIEDDSLKIMKESLTGDIKSVSYDYFDERSQRIYGLDLSEVKYITTEVME
ncbi:hypothetical protein D3Y89_01330 [Listeria monocytogenes]|nr:hypothetical protein [Listeria monocytogenes]